MITLRVNNNNSIQIFANLLPGSKQGLTVWLEYYDGQQSVPVDATITEGTPNVLCIAVNDLPAQQSEKAVLLLKRAGAVVYRDEVYFPATSEAAY